MEENDHATNVNAFRCFAPMLTNKGYSTTLVNVVAALIRIQLLSERHSWLSQEVIACGLRCP